MCARSFRLSLLLIVTGAFSWQDRIRIISLRPVSKPSLERSERQQKSIRVAPERSQVRKVFSHNSDERRMDVRSFTRLAAAFQNSTISYVLGCAVLAAAVAAVTVLVAAPTIACCAYCLTMFRASLEHRK